MTRCRSELYSSLREGSTDGKLTMASIITTANPYFEKKVSLNYFLGTDAIIKRQLRLEYEEKLKNVL
jgi:hypothetical protein